MSSLHQSKPEHRRNISSSNAAKTRNMEIMHAQPIQNYNRVLKKESLQVNLPNTLIECNCSDELEVDLIPSIFNQLCKKYLHLDQQTDRVRKDLSHLMKD